jgi:hypothetical protein
MRSLLEPSALHPDYPDSVPDSAWESEIEASKAISLKRIADNGDRLLDFLAQHSWEGAIQVRDVRRH